ncbi:MAG TPA: lytic transglycosylase domain-containing protein, partial [Paracoccus sp. (in: a-proteobacteria)]|nr:lytic transglycosylase domain-containing protein [Paracoccus sp. (in: a-proteobacteria)]
AEAMGDATAAQAAYARAAQHQSAFYGQLAAERIGAPMDPALAVAGRGVETLPDWRGSALAENGVFQAGVWLIAAGQPGQGQRFFLHLAESAPPDDIARMARLMMELHRPWDALRLAKAAAARGGVYPAAHFPLTGLERGDLGLPPELVMSIARRESEFNHTVSSRAGARGLMQVMPGTAEQMARQLGLPYELARLTRDAAYNARLGAAYLTGLRDRFGGSVALVAAGYNAGPGRSARWLDDFGDLRRAGPGGADPVDWVEMIPFDETRTYVMRVAESLPIYRARIAGRPVPIVPTWDLRGGGLMPVPKISPLVLALSQRPPPTPPAVHAAARLAAQPAAPAGPAGPGRAADEAGSPLPSLPPAPQTIAPEPAPASAIPAVQDAAAGNAPPVAVLQPGDGGAWPAAPILERLSGGGYALPDGFAEATATR